MMLMTSGKPYYANFTIDVAKTVTQSQEVRDLVF